MSDNEKKIVELDGRVVNLFGGLPQLTRRTFLGRAAMTSAAAFLAACGITGGPAPSGTGTSAAKKGGHFIEADTTEVKSVNPLFFSGEEGGDWIGHMLFAGLLTGDAKGVSTPVLASAMPTVSSDEKTITFKLKQGVKWSDGKELTADDVVYTYTIHSDPAYKNTKTGQRLAGRFDSITAPDPYTIVFKLTKVWPAFLIANAHYGIIPKSVFGSLSPDDLNTTPLNQNPTVVSGAWKMASFKQGQQVELARNDASFMGGASLENYVLRQLATSSAIVNALATGEIDMGVLDPSLLSRVQSLSNVTVYSYVSNGCDFLYYQLDPAKPGSVFFSDVRVRQALVHALDREKMIKSIYFDQAAVGVSVMPLSSWAQTTDGVAKYPFDKAKAESLLDAAGWKMGSSGVRQKDGKDMKFEIITQSGRAPYSDLVTSMVDQWRAIGVQASPKLLEANAATDQRINKRDFDTLFLPLTIGADPDVTPAWHSGAAAVGQYNSGKWSNAQADKAITDAANTNDIETRKKLYAQFQQIFMNELPAAPLFHPKALYGLSKRVLGVQDVLGAYDKYQRAWMRTVSVSDGK
jgi:peptide/nickel transport system substrate-binding protein